MKPINLKKAEITRGVQAINICFPCGNLKFDIFGTIEIAQRNAKGAETLSLKQAVEKYPKYFYYK